MYISLAAIMLVHLHYLLRNPIAIFAVTLYYSVYTKLLSVVFLEHVPTFISETAVFTQEIGADVRQIGVHCVFFLSIAFSLVASSRFFGRNNRSTESSIPSDYVFLLVAFLLSLQLLNVLFSGKAFLGDRFSLWSYVPLPILKSAMGVLLVFVPFYCGAKIGKYILMKQMIPRKNLGIACLLRIYLWASGQRFNGFFLGFCYFFMPFFYLVLNKKIWLRKFFLCRR